MFLDKRASTSSPPAAPTTAPRQLFNEETENELEKEMEVLREAVREENEVFEALEKITQDVITPELEKETRDNLKDKLTRYKSIMSKKENIMKATSEEIKSLKLSKEASKHGVVLQEQIIERQKKELDDSQKKNQKMKTEQENIHKELEMVRESNGSLH